MFQLENPTEKQATELLSQQNDLAVPTLSFTKNTDFTTFVAEYAFDGDDIVYHFFRPEERKGDDAYWKELFPNTLSSVAMSNFNATFPRLKAAYTSEVDSWWLRASGFANVGDPAARSERFFAQLDKAIDNPGVRSTQTG